MTDRDEVASTPGSTDAKGPRTRLEHWLLLDADRRVVTATVLSLLFVTFFTLGAIDDTPIREAMGSSDPIETVFQAMLGAVVTGVTIVVTINQLVLSQELGAVGDQRSRMRGAMNFRRDVEDALDRPQSPMEPSDFLKSLVDRTRSHAETLRDSVDPSGGNPLHRRTEAMASNLIASTDRVSERLAGAQFGTFEVLRAALALDYSVTIYEARRIQNEPGGSIDEHTRQTLRSLVDVLELYGSAREHFKTLYFQWELINLSRVVLYAAIPALAVSGSMVFYVDPSTMTGTLLGVDVLIWVASAAITVTLVPFALLLSYILRIATVAKRTLAIGPFVLRPTGNDGSDRE